MAASQVLAKLVELIVDVKPCCFFSDLDNAKLAGDGQSTADTCLSGHIKVPGGSLMGAGDMSGAQPPGTNVLTGGVSGQYCGDCLCPDGTESPGVITSEDCEVFGTYCKKNV